MSDPEEEMRPEYGFTGGVRGKYAQTYSEGTNLVLLDEDVSHAFPDSESVNSALRLLIRLAREAQEHSAE